MRLAAHSTTFTYALFSNPGTRPGRGGSLSRCEYAGLPLYRPSDLWACLHFAPDPDRAAIADRLRLGTHPERGRPSDHDPGGDPAVRLAACRDRSSIAQASWRDP